MFYVIDEHNVRFSEDRTVLIKAPESLSGTYEIPSSVNCIENNAFSNCINLEKIILSEAITELGKSIFNGCKNLKSIFFNSEIKEIGDYCFAGCESIEELSIPSSVQAIGAKAFCNCKSLKTILIPDNCICDRCTFEQCESLNQINIPRSWENIPYALFYGCISIEHIILPSTIKKIGESAFGGCSALITVDIGDGVVEIEKNAFDRCVNLRQLRFGLNLHKIGDKSFDFCRNLHTIYWDSIECFDFQYTPFSWESEYGTSVAPIKHCYFGHSVKHIPSYLCECLYGLEEIDIPENVETIGEHAFGCCNPIYIYLNKNITPSKLEEIFGAYREIDDEKFSDNIFMYCNRIEEFVVSIHNPYYASKDGNLYNKDFSLLIKIGRKCICSCEHLGKKERHLDISVKQIENFAGMGLDVTHLSIVECADIGKFAFYGCHNMKSVSFCGNTPKYFLSASNTLPLDGLPNSLRINYFAFGDCPKLEEIYWNIEDGNFPVSDSYQIWYWYQGEHLRGKRREYNLDRQISKITIGENISKLPTFFASLINVTELELPINIKEVNGGLPPHLSKLTLIAKGHASHKDPCDDGRNFVYQDGFVLSKDGSTLLRYIGEDEEIIIPSSVVNIADNALSFVSAKKIIFPTNLVEIGKSAFEHSSIESFYAPDSLLSIHERAFKDCYELTTLQLNTSLQNIDYRAFEDCIKLERITIPKTTEYKYDIVKGCSSLQELCISDDSLDLTGLTSLRKLIWDVKGDEDYWKFDKFAKDVRYDGRNTYYDKENSIAHQIETLILTDNVERIPRTFAKCMQITEIDIPQSVKHIGEEAFYYCPRLEKIILHSMDIEFDEDFCHFDKTHIRLYQEFEDCIPTKIFFEGKDVTDLFYKKNKEIVDARCRAEADAADFEQYVRDSYYGAYEGECDPNGDLL